MLITVNKVNTDADDIKTDGQNLWRQALQHAPPDRSGDRLHPDVDAPATVGARPPEQVRRTRNVSGYR